MHDSESRLVAILYRVKDLHLLLPAGFYRRFLCVCLRLIFHEDPILLMAALSLRSLD